MPSRSSYDAVILGCGLGGLVCGAYLSRSGLKPLLVEAQNRIGGRCGSNVHQGFAIDRMPFISHKTLLEVLDELRIDLPWHELPPNPAYIEALDAVGGFPGPGNAEEFAGLLGQPQEAVMTYRQVMKDLGSLPRARAAELKKTRIIDWVGPERWAFMKPVITADFQFRPWAITPRQASELSVGELVNLLSAGGPTESSIPQPKLYPAHPTVGGMQGVSASLGKFIRDSGGTIRTGCTATEVRVEGGKATGVSFINEDGVVEELSADIIISDIPVWKAFGTVLKASDFPPEMAQNARALGKWEAESISIGVAMKRLPTRRSDGKKDDRSRWCRILLGKKGLLTYGGGYIITSLGSPAAAPKGKHLLIVGRAVPKGTTGNPALMRRIVDRSFKVLRRIYSDFDDVTDWWRLLPGSKAPPIHCLSTVDRPSIVSPVDGLYFVGDTVETADGRPHCLDLAVHTGRKAARLIAGSNRAGQSILPGGG